MKDLTSVLTFALPFVLTFSLIEAIVLSWRARRQRAAVTLAGTGAGTDAGAATATPVEDFDWKAMAVSLVDQAGRYLLRLLPLSIATPFFVWAEQHRLFDIGLTTVWAVVLLFLGQEFCYYWYHRIAHRVRWFWANHAVHHSPNQLNLSAAYRLGWMGKIAGAPIFFTPLVWLGFDAKVVIAVLSINLLYQFWIHATWIPKLGVLEYVLNTPSAHRVHHASNLRYLDANYGGVLIVFDRLFGTYVEEREDEPCVYGLVKPMRSYNPLRVEFDQWISLWRDVVNAGSVGNAIRYLYKPPGWSPHGAGETTEEMRARALGVSQTEDGADRPPIVMASAS